MASMTLHAHPFPNGTVVSAYLREQLVNGGPPTGVATDSATVAGDGSLTFDGLAEGRRYVAYASGTQASFFMEPGSIDLLKPITGVEAQEIRTDLDSVQGSIGVVQEAPLNLKDERVGAAIDSSTDDTTAWQTAIDLLPSKGGVILHPGGEFSSIVSGAFPSLFGKKNITIKGTGGMNDTAGWASRILLDGAPAGRYIDARQSIGVRFEDIQLVYRNASFTGHLLDFGNAAGAGSDTRFCALSNCWLGGNPGTSAENAQSLLFLQNAHSIDAYKTAFMEGQVGVLGRLLNTEFSNRIGLNQCLFYNNHVAHIKNADASWVADQCTFQQLRDGTAGMYRHDAGVVAQSLAFRDCWAGDITVASGPQIIYSGDCLVIDGGRIGAEHASASFIQLDENDCHGIVIGGCNFVGPGTPVLAFGATTGHTGWLLPNEYDNVAAITSGTVPANFLIMEADGYLGDTNFGGNASLGASSAVGVHVDTDGFVDHTTAASTSAAIRTGVAGETNVRLRIAASGEMQIGPGSGGADVTLARLAAATWGSTTQTLVGGSLRTQHVAAATPTGGTSGDIKVGNGKIWVNDAGTWKSVGIA